MSDEQTSTTRVRFTVSYDGTDYCGWQKQNHMPNPAVAEVIEKALEKIFGEKIALSASGRTDAGVHALNQVCHFDTKRSLKPGGGWDFCWALNGQLPLSIRAKKAWIAPPEFHSTLSATHKTYRYLVLNRPRQSALLARYTTWVRKPINIDFLNECSELILGNQDFKAFQSNGTPVKSTTREIYKAAWTRKNNDILQFEITGSGFLKQMVRNIVGTHLMLDKYDRPASDMTKIIQSLDRKQAGPAVEPQGLLLYRVYYPQDLDNRCLEL